MRNTRVAIGSKGVTIVGNIQASTSIDLMSHVIGDVDCTETIVVSGGAVVEGNVHGATVIVTDATISGDVTGDERVSLNSGSCVKGDVKAGALSVEMGAVFNGSCKMNTEEKK